MGLKMLLPPLLQLPVILGCCCGYLTSAGNRLENFWNILEILMMLCRSQEDWLKLQQLFGGAFL